MSDCTDPHCCCHGDGHFCDLPKAETVDAVYQCDDCGVRWSSVETLDIPSVKRWTSSAYLWRRVSA